MFESCWNKFRAMWRYGLGRIVTLLWNFFAIRVLVKIFLCKEDINISVCGTVPLGPDMLFRTSKEEVFWSMCTWTLSSLEAELDFQTYDFLPISVLDSRKKSLVRISTLGSGNKKMEKFWMFVYSFWSEKQVSPGKNPKLSLLFKCNICK